jgi:hypothetical protein
MVEEPGKQEQDAKRRPSSDNVGAQQRHDRGSLPPHEHDSPARDGGPEGRDVPPPDAPRNRRSPWMGGG